ncbi:PASTA domain-containing protein [Micromonospora sp. PLK6-60]|uniref:PASTA domain-containing protein n=1 Tax=Micromonospora sp. PLK6-60 TaxID=2873383 RepID=UPI001CA692F0|nr:PASTA domain-containing protein [Micromonospora sp. PLK6-60]MBY8875538.1 PASTA domain-containing protein [Micromonospora sp. PLK6-60]
MSDRRDQPSAGDADDSTRPLPRPGEPVPADDSTRPLPRPGGEPAAADDTRLLPGGAGAGEPIDRTRALPPVEGRTTGRAAAGASPGSTAPLPPEPAVWSGRAEVPVTRPGEYRESATEWYAPEPGGRRWWTPILVGILALLLVALIGAGVWLLLRGQQTGTGPQQSPSPVPTAAPTTAAPTTTAPSTRPASTPPSTAADRVRVPPLVGLPQETAERLLDRIGLEHRTRTRESDRPPGTVLETDPEAGERVPADSEVTLVVAEPRTEPTTTAPTTGAPPSPEATTTTG